MDERYFSLSAAGNLLEQLLAVVDFELFAASLTRRSTARTGPGLAGRVTMELTFKALVLQTL